MRFLVVDSGPIIRGARIEQMGAERLVTIPEVLSEIRDEQARARLAALPCELEVREPSEEALLAIKRFAKLTGDLPVLSSVDLRVLALAWMLEKQECDGTEHLRTEPLPRGAAAQKLRLQQRAAAAAVSSEPAPAQRELPTFIESSFGSRAEYEAWAAEQRAAQAPAAAAPAAGEAAAGLEAEMRALALRADTAAAAAAPAPGVRRSGAAPWGGGKQAQQKQGAQLAAPRPGAAEAAPVAWAEEGAALPGGGAEEEVRFGGSDFPSLAEASSGGGGAAASESLLPGWPADADERFADAGEEGEGVDEEGGEDGEEAAAAAEEEEEEEEEEVVEEVLDDRPCLVLPGLYVGSVDAARNASALLSCGISHVLTVAKEELALPDAGWAAGLAHELVPVEDSEDENLLPHFDRCADFIDSARASLAPGGGGGGGVLVHCLAGRSRSVAVVCAYLMRTADEPLSVAAALRRVQQLRPWAQPNPSFLVQLREYEQRLRAPPPAAAAAAAAAGLEASGGREEFEESTPLEGDEDPDLPWITPANLRKTQASDARHAGAPKETTRVGCITTDYAMQSVLLQMGLKLLSVDGMLLRSIKQWVLRCSGCYKEHRQLELQFCSKCGNASLVRLAAIVDNRGNQRLLPEKGAPARVRSTNIRGTKYAMPMPKAGRHANNLVLAEDQLLEAQEKSRKQGRKKGHDVFDPDYDVDAHFGRAGKKGAASRVNVKVGYGKKNPNDVRSRPKRT